jgi:hypothetical protein
MLLRRDIEATNFQSFQYLGDLEDCEICKKYETRGRNSDGSTPFPAVVMKNGIVGAIRALHTRII